METLNTGANRDVIGNTTLAVGATGSNTRIYATIARASAIARAITT
jgi:hypothetical protein